MERAVKKLGLVGGTGPESTVPYYLKIVHGVRERAGNFPNLTIESISVFDVLEFCRRADYDGLLTYLLRALDALSRAGATFAALTGNTPHIVFPQLQARSPIPLISMVESSCQEARRLGLKRLGLLGTRFTMEADFFKAPFQAQGIEIVTPAPEDRLYIDRLISQELELGRVTPAAQETVDGIIRALGQREGIEAAILGCTELPLLYRDRSGPLPLLDTMEVHIRALIDQLTAPSDQGDCG